MKSFRHFILSSMRELIFGLEDSLVSTLGTITGIAIGTQSTYIVILSGFVLIAAESTSMAAGSYLSSVSASEAEEEWNKEQRKKHHHVRNHPIRGAGVMWISYLLGGLIPIAPYFFLSTSEALLPSIFFTVVSLFLVGVWSAAVTKRSFLRSGLEMVIVSLSAAFIGYVIGRLVNVYFGNNSSF
jgi:vacuolar iron transporter family protein